MRESITQFMWGFQQHFRHGIQYEADLALRAVGADLRPEVILIGVRTDPDRPFPICVEPETGALQPEHFANLEARTEEIFTTDPESTLINFDRRVHDARMQWLWRRARAAAITEIVEASAEFSGYRFDASYSTPLGGYDVHTCIGVDAEGLDALAALSSDAVDRIHVTRSLVLGAIEYLCDLADHALFLPDPGSSLRSTGRTTGEIVRHAASRFAEGCVVRSGEWSGGDLFDRVVDISQQRYEGTGARGRLLLARRDHPSIEVVVTLQRPVATSKARSVRKLLQTSGPDLALLTDGRTVYGLGRQLEDYDELNQDLFEIVVVDHATWEIRHGSDRLLRASYGVASLPEPAVDKAQFEEAFERIFGDQVSSAAVWRSVDAATTSAHGALIVISANAELEAARLRGQATLIAPVAPAPEVVSHLCEVDGALLLAPDGTCHAFGVILDGVASTLGDPGRGARFNSSVRYLTGATPATMICIVSEDQTIDVLPEFHRRIPHSDVTLALEQLARFAGTGSDGETFYEAWKLVESLAFYLNADECDEANQLYEREQEARSSAGGMTVTTPPLRPDPGMNPSFFLPDD